MSRTQTIKILPYQFIHILDTNTNVSRVELGPQTYIILDHEKLLTSTAQNMITPSKRSYSKVANPVVRDESGTPVVDQYGQVKLKHGEVEYRFFKDFSEAYALYPGEKLEIDCAPLQVVEEDCAIRLRANRDFADGEMVRSAGDEWLFKGPATYYPRIEEDVIKMEKAIIVDENKTVRIKASQDLVDSLGNPRKSGEEWILREIGAYMPGVHEVITDSDVRPHIFGDEYGIILKALQNFTDIYGVERKAGEEWLITNKVSCTHIIDVYEEFVSQARFIVLLKNEYCVILDPFVDGKNKLGTKIIKRGEQSFFLNPGESLQHNEIKQIHVLGEKDALLVRAMEAYTQIRIHDPKMKALVDAAVSSGKGSEVKLVRNTRNGYIQPIHQSLFKGLKDYEEEYKLQSGEKLEDFTNDICRTAGERWMEYGPLSYLPPVGVEVLDTIQEIPLDKNEGIYVRNIRTGDVRAIMGEPYMLNPNEELYEYKLGDDVESLLYDRHDKT